MNNNDHNNNNNMLSVEDEKQRHEIDQYIRSQWLTNKTWVSRSPGTTSSFGLQLMNSGRRVSRSFGDEFMDPFVADDLRMLALEIPRGFRAQLLANVQLATEKKKLPVVDDGVPVFRKGRVVKEAIEEDI
ncbi:hypothetical protein LWI29_029429 [Acer saccharum]|uniref:Uncharacterized protein n=1 Tax=Acer saccharum TaxID=4024 RepID=A0AA39W797_ACESA|nr:hypothetical protein LWI29_029429 [Acer saccharum]